MILNSNVLVLDSGYSPVDITTVRKAFGMLFREIAHVVEVITNNEDKYYENYDLISWIDISEIKKELEDNFEFINTPSKVVGIPRIIRLVDYYDGRPKRVRLTRRNLFERDNYTCLYCDTKFSSIDLTIDHIIPRSKGGRTTWKNVATACLSCNSKKSDLTLKKAGMKLKHKPFIPTISASLHRKVKEDRYKSWEHFISDIYWNIPLVK